MKKKKLNIKKVGIVCIFIIAVVIAGFVFFKQNKADKNTKNETPINTQTSSKDTNAFSKLSYYHSENLTRYQTYQKDNPSYSIEDIVTHVNMGIDTPFYTNAPIEVEDPDALTVIINKVYSLPSSWAPDDLEKIDDYKGQKARKVAVDAFHDFQDACNTKGFNIYAHSGYRSTEFQQRIYDNMIKTYGQEYTDSYVSRPGQSEHTTGLCIDVSIDGIHYEDIEQSAHYTWFKEHMVEYGFILRYPENKEKLTGYNYESWHIRYLGKELAKKVKDSGLTYDEYVARQA